MPKAKPYPDGDGDEASTAVESEWGDEPSTTIEHGQVADKLRPLPPTKPGSNGTHLTQTGTGLDEMTVDDQHAAQAVLSAITPIRPESIARLAITQGNDAGQEVEIRPGKSYTIGRAIDNDIVLTDISVSRKHFDLKHEDGSWVVIDRGSGNGTVVNGNLEDNPFMLATGDVIEIGNTVFRFDQVNGVPRTSAPTYDLGDEELSTIAGKPPSDPDEMPPAPPRPMRPKTSPPPPPLPPPALRPTSRSTPPPLSAYAQAQQQLQPASTLPMAQMANRAPLAGPHSSASSSFAPGSPTMLGDAMGLPVHLAHNAASSMSTTLPGQVPMRPSYPYPQAHEAPPHSVHAQMLHVQAQHRRGDHSTAHVQPVPYQAMQMAAQSRSYAAPQLSRRTKMLIAGIALAVLTGIVTAAVVKSGDKAKPVASKGAGSGKQAKTESPTQIAKQQPVVEPIKDTGKPANLTVSPIKPEPPKEPTLTVATTTPKQGQPKQEPPKQEQPKQEQPKQEQPKQEQPKQEQPKQEPKVVKQEPKRSERKREPRREPTPKRVAAASSAADPEALLEKAEGLYKERNFNGAAKVLADAAKSLPEDEAKKLRFRSDVYSKFGKAYSLGTVPGQKASVAFENLQQASNYDRSLANHFDGDLQTRLGAIAPKAAVAYLAAGQYARARSAVIAATRLGSSDSNLSLVKQKLESVAGELYNEASKEMSSNPTAARDKLKLLKTYVDPKSSWATKADALLKKA